MPIFKELPYTIKLIKTEVIAILILSTLSSATINNFFFHYKYFRHYFYFQDHYFLTIYSYEILKLALNLRFISLLHTRNPKQQAVHLHFLVKENR